jgi:uncharacterized protein (DUF2267 family)
MDKIVSHYTPPIQMARAEFRAICDRLDSDEAAGIENSLDKMLAEYRKAGE